MAQGRFDAGAKLAEDSAQYFVRRSVHPARHTLYRRVYPRLLVTPPLSRHTREHAMVRWHPSMDHLSLTKVCVGGGDSQVRHDGTLSYFFTPEELGGLAASLGLVVEKSDVIAKEVIYLCRLFSVLLFAPLNPAESVLVIFDIHWDLP
jgi:hypothetical protein